MIWCRADAGVELNGSGVSSWTDMTGNGADFAQSTAAEQPELITGPSGRPALRFENDDDSSMSNAASGFNMHDDLTDTAEWTVAVAVSDWTPTSSNASFFGAAPVICCGTGTASMNVEIGICVSSTTVNPVPLMGGVEASTPAAYAYANTATEADVSAGDPFVAVLWSDGSNWNSRTNGTDGDGEAAVGLRGNADVFIIGTAKPPLASGLADEQFTGNLMEVLVWDGALSEQELSVVESYLMDRYKIG